MNDEFPANQNVIKKIDSMCLSLCFSHTPPLCLSLSPFLSFFLSLCLSLSLPFYHSVSVSRFLSVFLSFSLSLCPSFSLSLSISVSLYALPTENTSFTEKHRPLQCSDFAHSRWIDTLIGTGGRFELGRPKKKKRGEE